METTTTTVTALGISRQDLERAVPAAKTKNDVVFGMLRDAIRGCYCHLIYCILGDVGQDAAESGENEELTWCVKKIVCMTAFTNKMSSLDLVLTPTGFGVVSTQDTAPASAQRVSALRNEMLTEVMRARDTLYSMLFKIDGWGLQQLGQSKESITSLFWRFDFLESHAGFQNATRADWDIVQPKIQDADYMLRRKIGDEYMDSLLKALKCDNVSAEDYSIVLRIQTIIGRYVMGNGAIVREMTRTLVDTLEKNIEKYPLYAESEAYKTNHPEVYENTKESPLFIFGG